MGSAYVPGLKVSADTDLHLERRLPLKGEVVVQVGQEVSWDTVVAKTNLPGSVSMVNIAAMLGVEPSEVPECMLKAQGDAVGKGEGLARSKGFFGYFRSTLEAPISGTVESISGVSGQVVIRAQAEPVEVCAYVNGVVERCLENEGVVIASRGVLIQGIFGIGGETSGRLSVLANSPDQPLKPEDISEKDRDCVVVGGSLATNAVLHKAISCGVKGLVVGGIDDKDLRDFLGYDLGVAITGSENKGITLIITEGFGEIPMSERTFALFLEHVGDFASMSGATQIRAGVIRPEIIIPRHPLNLNAQPCDHKAPTTEPFCPGARVRLIREPHFGALATVINLPVQPVQIPTGAKVRVAEIELTDGERMVIPRANLELLEG